MVILRRLLFVSVLLLAGVPNGWAVLVLDYSHDTSTDAFFTANPTAKAAVDAAAADISALIATTLTPITNDVIVGTNGATSIAFDWGWSYTNPSTGASETFNPAVIAGDQMTIYVGMRELSGGTLAQGGRGSVSLSVSGSGFESQLAGAVADAEAQSNAVYGRGGGPTMTSLGGTLTLGAASADFSVSHGPSLGNLWFDIDTNNDTATDSSGQLEAFWHYDHTTPVAAGKFDLYSVALHEILHAMGIGTSESWLSFLSGTSDWTGPNAIAANGGSGEDLIDPASGAHIALNTLSTRISDGMIQEVVMDPNIGPGVRKGLTVLDLAFLSDIGWDLSVVPEASSFLCCSLVAGVIGTTTFRRKRARRRRVVGARRAMA